METQSQAIGQSKGGWTTKILALVDALGNLVRFVLMPANRHDTIGVAPLIKDVSFDALLADEAYDSNWIIEEMYKWRHLIENYFQKLKKFKGIAMRPDKTDTSYAAMITLCAAIINSR